MSIINEMGEEKKSCVYVRNEKGFKGNILNEERRLLFNVMNKMTFLCKASSLHTTTTTTTKKRERVNRFKIIPVHPGKLHHHHGTMTATFDVADLIYCLLW